MKPTLKMIEAGARALISRNSLGRVELGDLDEEHREEARDEALHVLQAAFAAMWSDDMESAPSDGTRFLAFWPAHDDVDLAYTEHQSVTWETSSGRFVTDGSVFNAHYPKTWKPTHWMPLPQPPEAP